MGIAVRMVLSCDGFEGYPCSASVDAVGTVDPTQVNRDVACEPVLPEGWIFWRTRIACPNCVQRRRCKAKDCESLAEWWKAGKGLCGWHYDISKEKA